MDALKTMWLNCTFVQYPGARAKCPAPPDVAKSHQQFKHEYWTCPFALNQCLSIPHEISTKVVHKFVEKHPLDMLEARWNAAFNTLPID
jgi:hypothetical protein